jgi:hypothetical protein
MWYNDMKHMVGSFSTTSKVQDNQRNMFTGSTFSDSTRFTDSRWNDQTFQLLIWKDFSSLSCPDQLQGQSSFLSDRKENSFLGGKAVRA